MYENRALFKYLIYNVINSKKCVSARKYKNLFIFIRGIFVKVKNKYKEYIGRLLAFACLAARLSKSMFDGKGVGGEAAEIIIGSTGVPPIIEYSALSIRNHPDKMSVL